MIRRRRPSYVDRIAALASALGAATDIAAVLAVRSELLALGWEALALGYARGRRDLREARMLRRQSELVAGQMLLSMRARGIRCEGGFRSRKTAEGRSRVSLDDLGLCWATAARWERRAREFRAAASGEKAGGRTQSGATRRMAG